MVKLVILIEPGDDNRRFEEGWPQFLHNAEEMPGLQREATSHVDTMLYGSASYVLMHELFFNSLADAQQAMASPAGKAAGQTLQGITGGKLVLFFADHKEDDIANIRRFRPGQVGTER
jgi:uncharacterized protein (TIGR02118 family)